MPDVRDKIVILTDDGAATGSSLSLAVQTIRQQGAAQVIVALPVASSHAVSQLNKTADQVVCLMEPRRFMTVGHWYQEFDQMTDREVFQILERVSVRVAGQKSA